MEGDSWSGDRKKWQKNVGNDFLSTSDPYGQRKESWLDCWVVTLLSLVQENEKWSGAYLPERENAVGKSALTVILQALV